MIKLENVYYKYKNGDNVLENINLQINEGQIISIIGKNGTGKSTILNLISGIIKPTKGDILIDDINTKSKKDFLELRKKIGMVFQNPDSQILFPRVHEDMEFALKNLNLTNRNQRIDEALKIVNLQNFQDKDTYELSLGQKQRINIASVLAIKPKYIVLDEPTTMIDPMEKENIYNCLRRLKKEGYTIIFVTNNIDEILLSDKILIIENKQVRSVLKKEEVNIGITLKEWTISEMINEIVKVCKNEKHN